MVEGNLHTCTMACALKGWPLPALILGPQMSLGSHLTSSHNCKTDFKCMLNRADSRVATSTRSFCECPPNVNSWVGSTCLSRACLSLSLSMDLFGIQRTSCWTQKNKNSRRNFGTVGLFVFTLRALSLVASHICVATLCHSAAQQDPLEGRLPRPLAESNREPLRSSSPGSTCHSSAGSCQARTDAGQPLGTSRGEPPPPRSPR